MRSAHSRRKLIGTCVTDLAVSGRDGISPRGYSGLDVRNFFFARARGELIAVASNNTPFD